MDQNLSKLFNCISSLRDTDKHRINEISLLADSFKGNELISEQISEFIMCGILKANKEEKLSLFYVMDSILKNTREPYNKYFSKSVIATFVDTFKACKGTNTRQKLYKLRLTWKDKQFPYEITHELDKQIRAIDPQWPIIDKRLTSVDEGAVIRKRKSDMESAMNVEEMRKSKSMRLSPPQIGTENGNADKSPEMWGSTNIRKLTGFPDLDVILAKVNTPPMSTQTFETSQPIIYEEYNSSSVQHFDMNTQQTLKSLSWNDRQEENLQMDTNMTSSVDEAAINSKMIKSEFIIQPTMEDSNKSRPMENGTIINSTEIYASNDVFDKLRSIPNLDAILAKAITPPASTQCLPTMQSLDSEEYNSAQQPPAQFQTFPTYPTNFNNVPYNVPIPNNVPIPYNVPIPNSQPEPFPYFPNNRHTDRNIPIKNYPYFWSQKISGFPQMPRIGTDPRWLFQCPFPDSPKTVCIDDKRHVVCLNRIQPYTIIDNCMHAVRYVCSFINLLIDGVNFQLSTNEVNLITFRNKWVSMCIGGPFHELIIDGWPYHVPMDGRSYIRQMGDIEVDFAFNVKKEFRCKIMPAIPKFICDWVEASFFGHPKEMAIAPPKNPLANMALRDAIATQFRMEIERELVQCDPVSYTQPNVVFPTSGRAEPNHRLTPPTTMAPTIPTVKLEPSPSLQQGDVMSLMQKLIASGLVPNLANAAREQIVTHDTPIDLDFTKYKYESFRRFNAAVVHGLYADPQCDICGTRFTDKNSTEFVTHMDYHYFKASVNLTTKLKTRGYFRGSKSWVIGQQMQTAMETERIQNEPTEAVKEKCQKFEDRQQNVCSVCNDGFEEDWDKDEESYMLVNAILFEGKVYHPVCVEDVGKSFKIEKELIQIEEVKEEKTVTDPILLFKELLQGRYQLPTLSNAV